MRGYRQFLGHRPSLLLVSGGAGCSGVVTDPLPWLLGVAKRGSAGWFLGTCGPLTLFSDQGSQPLAGSTTSGPLGLSPLSYGKPIWALPASSTGIDAWMTQMCVGGFVWHVSYSE